jgi:small subunit ribosomal protein S17
MGCEIGDQVQIVETRPLSRDKRWIVEAILSREVGAGEEIVGDQP